MLNLFESFLRKLPKENQGKYQGKSFHVYWTNSTTRIAKYQIPRSVSLTVFEYTRNNFNTKTYILHIFMEWDIMSIYLKQNSSTT